jgi:hypothetical protein
MDRQIVYPGAIPLETDILNTNRNVLTGIGALIQDLFGTNTIFSGLGCVATSPASMSVTINPGRVYSLQFRDPVAYSSLGQDVTNQIMKQGILLAAQTLACPAPLTSGFSQNYLVSAAFVEADINPVVLPYYNASNPQQAFSGPPVGGVSSGTAQNTTRQDTVALTLTPGIAAATGTQTTPATPVGTTPLWVVTVTFGQTTITAANISAVAGSPFVPTGGYLAAVGERFNSIQNVSTSSTLTTAALGALVNITATGTTQTLPLAASCPNGTCVSLAYMQASGSATVTRNGTDSLAFGQGNSASSLTLSPGEEVQFVSNGANGWTSAGQTLSTGVTPPPGDSSQKLVTTNWVLPNTPGRLLQTTVFTIVGGVQQVSVNGGAFSTVGASTFTSLSATNKIRVRAVGAAGGSGGTAATGTTTTAVSGGGTSGAYGESLYLSGFSGGLPVTVGVPGTAGAAGANSGGNGGTTSLGTLLTCPGGMGGVGGSAVSTSATVMVTYAAQSVAPTGANVVSMQGQAATPTFVLGNTASGSGGSNPLGTGDHAHTGSPSGSGSGYGAGAGGAAMGPSSAATAGTAGQPGAVIIEEFA